MINGLPAKQIYIYLLLFTSSFHNFTGNSFHMKAKALCSIFLISSISLLIISKLSAQYSWSVPISITDSQADNRNPVIVDLKFNGTYDHFIFWERSQDSTATAIYYRNFYNADEPVALLAAENVHYRNPQFIKTYSLNEDTLFFFFYECDINGNFDVYYQVYTVLGFGSPQLFAGSDSDESHFRCNGAGSMVWQEGDKIKYASLHNWDKPFIISGLITIDSINCSEPQVAPNDYYNYEPYISWLKTSGDYPSIYYSYYSGSWSTPILLYDSGFNISPQFAMSACYQAGSFGDVMTWETVADEQHTIKAYSFSGNEFTGNFTQQSSFSPVMCLYAIPVDQLYETGFMAFVNADSQNGDIFVNEDGMWIPEDLMYYIDISDSPNQETNPAFFNGRCMGDYCDLIVIWESQHNDRQQLYYSLNSLGCAGSINETAESQALDLMISPNPVLNECDINYTLLEDTSVSLQLCTLDGRQIFLVDQKFLQKGTYTFHLDFDKVFQGGNYTGLFMIKLQAGNSIVAQKVIKMH
jgi:hypothetical protein